MVYVKRAEQHKGGALRLAARSSIPSKLMRESVDSIEAIEALEAIAKFKYITQTLIVTYRL